MKWELVPVDTLQPVDLYDLAQRHCLVPDNLPFAIQKFRTMASSARLFEVRHEERVVANIIVSGIVEGEDGYIDFIPDVKRFANDSFKRPLKEAVGPLLRELFQLYRLRRMTAQTPAARTRTVKALLELGFEQEGHIREAVKFRGKKPEDVLLFGLLACNVIAEED